MDLLSRYIQEGKKLSIPKLIVVFLTLSILIVGVIGIRFNYALSEPDMHSFLKEFPEIEIENGSVIKPDKTVWEKKLANDRFLIRIDTEHDMVETFPETGIVLTRKDVILTLDGQRKVYQLPAEKVVIDTPVLKQFFQIIIINTCIIIGLILFIIFLLGQASTIILSSGLLYLLRKEADKDYIRRSSFISWLLILGLNMFLFPFNHGLSLMGCIGIATLISVFCLMWVNKKA